MISNRHYMLGGHTFESVDEYWDAQHDMKKIDIISRNLDVHDPEVAIRLYNMIRDGEIAFATPIGMEFTEHVTDILADKSVGLLDTKRTVDTAEKKVRRQRRLGISVAVIAACAAIFFGSSQITELISTRKLESMATSTRAARVDTAERLAIAESNTRILQEAAVARREAMTAEIASYEQPVVVDEEQLTILPEFEALLAANPDVRGWLTIEDTNVDYPVMQRVGDFDNEYYLDKNFDGAKDSNGSLFIDFRSNIVNPTENTIIYGHNMNSGKMFGDLKKYLDENYYINHKAVKFDTIYEERDYEIVAVCLSKVQDATADSFRYYNFIDAKNEEEWNSFVDNINALSVFSVDVDLELGDEVLTLSTCNSYTEDGRLFLVAKRII